MFKHPQKVFITAILKTGAKIQIQCNNISLSLFCYFGFFSSSLVTPQIIPLKYQRSHGSSVAAAAEGGDLLVGRSKTHSSRTQNYSSSATVILSGKEFSAPGFLSFSLFLCVVCASPSSHNLARVSKYACTTRDSKCAQSFRITVSRLFALKKKSISQRFLGCDSLSNGWREALQFSCRGNWEKNDTIILEWSICILKTKNNLLWLICMLEPYAACRCSTGGTYGAEI